MHNKPIDSAEVIRNYANPLFGFALNRLRNRNEAEDLAQEIAVQLIKSLSSGTEIHNMDAYVWTIAKYCWVHWVNKQAKAPMPSELNGFSNLLRDTDQLPLEQLLESETYFELRREIAFLSGIHRRIVILHYYEGMKQSDIAKVLAIPVGTVKWHLHDAKKELRKGMEQMREPGLLSFNPIQFTKMGHSGTPGQLGETNDFLGRTLAQNIIYAAYQRPLSVNEIAKELAISPVLLEDEVRYLAEYAFLTEVSPGNYQSNTIIWNTTMEQKENIHNLYHTCASEIADIHYNALLAIRKEVETLGINTPDQDYNFLLWTLLPMNIEAQSWYSQPLDISFDSVAPRRKDGGHYIAYANLAQSNPPHRSYTDSPVYSTCGPMNRSQSGSPLYLWQMNTYWSSQQDWRFLHFQDVQICDLFRRGELADDEQHREEYAFLLEKEYIRRTADGYRFNAIWIDSRDTLDRLQALMPDLSSTYAPSISKLYHGLLNQMMLNQPKHLKSQIAYSIKQDSCGGLLTAYILKHLIDNGKLQPPLPHQSKTITTWMGPVN